MARPRLGESETKRLQMVITEDELSAIDAWRAVNRIGSRSHAIRRLVEISLSIDEAVGQLAGRFSQASGTESELRTLFEEWWKTDGLAVLEAVGPERWKSFAWLCARSFDEHSDRAAFIRAKIAQLEKPGEGDAVLEALRDRITPQPTKRQRRTARKKTDTGDGE